MGIAKAKQQLFIQCIFYSHIRRRILCQLVCNKYEKSRGQHLKSYFSATSNLPPRWPACKEYRRIQDKHSPTEPGKQHQCAEATPRGTQTRKVTRTTVPSTTPPLSSPLHPSSITPTLPPPSTTLHPDFTLWETEELLTEEIHDQIY